MTNVSGSTKKVLTRKFLFQTAIRKLELDGWKVERIAKAGKASVRLISKGAEKKKISIRTSQDTWIAFPRLDDESGWSTLGEVDAVVAASVDQKIDAKRANFHMIPADDLLARFDRAFEARKAVGSTPPTGRGVWVALYDKGTDPVSLVGGGAGKDYPAFATADLPAFDGTSDDEEDGEVEPSSETSPDDGPMAIPEAKRRLALTFGVDPSAIKIIVEG